VATFLLPGGRKAEVLGLTAEDIIFDRDLVHFRQNGFRRLKTRNATRTVRLWPQLKEIFQRHIFEAGHVIPGSLCGPGVFFRCWWPKGRPLHSAAPPGGPF